MSEVRRPFDKYRDGPRVTEARMQHGKVWVTVSFSSHGYDDNYENEADLNEAEAIQLRDDLNEALALHDR